MTSALDIQVAGDHYKKLKIQPIEYIHANSIPFAEGCAIKYLTRWREKGGIKDLEKAKHFIELLIELEIRDASSSTSPIVQQSGTTEHLRTKVPASKASAKPGARR